MKQYDSGIDDLSVEIIQNQLLLNYEYNNKRHNGFISFILKLFHKNKSNENNMDFNEFIIKKINNDYYREEYKDLRQSEMESEDERKFREVYQKQQNIIKNSNILNKTQTMEQLIYEMDIIYDAYDLPELTINNKEWDIYFNKTYRLFINNGIEDKFYEYMRASIRFILAKSLVNNNYDINKNDFIEGLDYLKVYDDIKLDDINNLKKELNIILKNNKIIEFNDYKRKRRI